MSRPEDHQTSTVDGAAGYEQWRAGLEPDPYADYTPDRPDLPDELDEDAARGHRPGCFALDPSECTC